jgi:hypothetical protein
MEKPSFLSAGLPFFPLSHLLTGGQGIFLRIVVEFDAGLTVLVPGAVGMAAGAGIRIVQFDHG